jgi:hypothetical protein
MDWIAPAPGDTLIAIDAPMKANQRLQCTRALSAGAPTDA